MEGERTAAAPGGHPAGTPASIGSRRSILDNKWALRLLVYGGIVLAWQVTAMVKGEFFLPTIPATLAGIVHIFTEGYYVELLATRRQEATGFMIALTCPCRTRACFGRWGFVED